MGRGLNKVVKWYVDESYSTNYWKYIFLGEVPELVEWA